MLNMDGKFSEYYWRWGVDLPFWCVYEDLAECLEVEWGNELAVYGKYFVTWLQHSPCGSVCWHFLHHMVRVLPTVGGVLFNISLTIQFTYHASHLHHMRRVTNASGATRFWSKDLPKSESQLWEAPIFLQHHHLLGMCTQAHQQKLDAGTESISRRHRANIARLEREITCGWYPRSIPNFFRSYSPPSFILNFFYFFFNSVTFLNPPCLLILCMAPDIKPNPLKKGCWGRV